MKKITLVLIMAALIVPAWAGDAESLPARTLRLNLGLGFGFAGHQWDNSWAWNKSPAAPVFTLNAGMGAEYGISNWLSAFVYWMPGPQLWAFMESGEAGTFSDSITGIKTQLMGEAAPIRRDDMRIALSLFTKNPFPADKIKTTDMELDRHLWGLGFSLSWDYIFTPNIFLNLYSDAVFYPVQRSANPSLGLGKVSHPADITLLEVEGRFKIPVQEGFAFIAALPLSYTLSPETKLDDIGRDDFEHRIALSPSVSISVTQIALPFDITLQYHAPFAGTNALVVHRFSLSGKVYIKL